MKCSFRELVKSWRKVAEAHGDECGTCLDHMECADELEAVIIAKELEESCGCAKVCDSPICVERLKIT